MPDVTITPTEDGRRRWLILAVAGYRTGFWWIAGIFASGAVVAGVLLRRGPLGQQRAPSPADDGVPAAQAGVGPARPG